MFSIDAINLTNSFDYPVKVLSDLAPIIAVLIFVILILMAGLIAMYCYMKDERMFWKSCYNDVYADLKEIYKEILHPKPND